MNRVIHRGWTWATAPGISAMHGNTVCWDENHSHCKKFEATFICNTASFSKEEWEIAAYASSRLDVVRFNNLAKGIVKVFVLKTFFSSACNVMKFYSFFQIIQLDSDESSTLYSIFINQVLEHRKSWKVPIHRLGCIKASFEMKGTSWTI